MPYDLGQRYGLDFRSSSNQVGGLPRIWIHAASVGEVQAARLLIAELISRKGKYEFFLSTMTDQGRLVARSQLPQEVTCFLAPVDFPGTVRRFLAAIKPDLYVSMETELWPSMFIELHRSGIPAAVLNGRITRRSFRRYQLIRGMMKRLLGGLDRLAVISQEDGERFKELGARAEIVRVTGNIKYDCPSLEIDQVRTIHRSKLQVKNEVVFICGSTRTGEEEMLIQVFNALRAQGDRNVLWVVAPRHLARVKEVKDILIRSGLESDMYSSLKSTARTHSVVLVDTMGDLAQLYSAGDFNFVGGSLIGQRGHNIMEAARWGRPVYYGPSIDDFKDAAEVLENAGGGFRVTDCGELSEILIDHMHNIKVYKKACASAAHAVSLQRGAAGKQADMLLELLQDPTQNI